MSQPKIQMQSCLAGRRGTQSTWWKAATRRFGFIGLAVVVFGAFSGGSLHAILQTAGSGSAINQNFQLVLSAMRRPAATGLLIVSLWPPGSAPRPALHPGDIITWVEHHRIKSRSQLAVILYHLRHSSLPLFSVEVARGDRIIHLRMPPSALAISGLAVMAGVPAPLNPPPTPFTMQWNRVPPDTVHTHHSLAKNYWYRLFDHHIAIGMVHLQISRAGTVGHLLWSVRAAAGCGVQTQRIHMIFSVGDNRRAPPFLITSLTFHDFRGHRRFIRRGALLIPVKPHAGTTVKKIPILFNVVPTPALTVLAMAMPRRKGLVLAVPEIGIRYLHTRPGCAMEVLGRKTVIFAGEKRRLWCVRMMRLDVPQITFWLDRFGHILRIDLPRHRRLFLAADAAAARTGLSLPKLPR